MSKFNYLYSDPLTANQVVGQTPYGIYDNDETFQEESIQVVKYVAQKLGHPVVEKVIINVRIHEGKIE